MNENPLKSVLVVDDEPDICELAEITLNRMGLRTQSANDVSTAKRILSEQHFDLCLTDMNLPDGDGIELIEYIQKNHAQTPVAVITAYGNMESAVRALKAGAFDCVSKPIDLQVLRKLVYSAIKLPAENTQTINIEKTDQLQLLGESPVLHILRKKIGKLARSQAPVYIHGESGSGKELVAQLIHQQGARADKPFIPINCGAIPSELVESEFFGHKKGSFTGATADKNGLFKAADEGTLFLDEVADLPMHMQVKLLRTIQEKTIRPVGAQHEQHIDVRILSASHKNLAELVKQGEFREDLYYRINVIELNVPALKNRSGDIVILTQYLLSHLTKKSNLKSIPRISTEAINALENYHFPGNVRELENILERAIALNDSDIIEKDDLHLPQQKNEEQPPISNNSNIKEQNLNLKDQEKEVIIHALEQNRWNKTAAAKQLGLSLRQLRYRLEKLNIG